MCVWGVGCVHMQSWVLQSCQQSQFSTLALKSEQEMTKEEEEETTQIIFKELVGGGVGHGTIVFGHGYL